MAWIRVIDEGEAEGDLKKLYEQISGARGKVANIMKVHSLNPGAMKAHMELYLEIMFRDSNLSREECELIATVVSAANGCEYCMRHHGEALNHYWKDPRLVEQLMGDFSSVELPRRARKMLEYAVKLTASPSAMSEADVIELRGQGLGDADILRINLVVSYFNFVNRIAQGLGVEFTPEEVGGYEY